MILKKPTFRSTCNRIGWCLCIMLGVMTACQFLTVIADELLLYVRDARAVFFVQTLLDTVFYLSYFIVPGLLFYAISRSQETEPIAFRLKMPAWSPLLILAGIAVTMCAATINAYIMQLIGFSIPDSMTGLPTDYSDPVSIALAITIALAPGFCEEFLFRGVIYGNLRRYGRSFAVILSSLLFAMMHQNPAQSFYTFVAGLMLALCYELTGSIWCGTFMHMFNNLYSVLGEIILARLGLAAYPILTMMDAVLYALGGVSAVILLVLLTRKKGEAVPDARGGLFGVTRLPEGGSSGSVSGEAGAPAAAVDFKRFFAPGMIVFTVFALIDTASVLLVGFGLPIPGL